MSRVPSPDEILAFLRENPGQTGKARSPAPSG